MKRLLAGCDISSLVALALSAGCMDSETVPAHPLSYHGYHIGMPGDSAIRLAASDAGSEPLCGPPDPANTDGSCLVGNLKSARATRVMLRYNATGLSWIEWAARIDTISA